MLTVALNVLPLIIWITKISHFDIDTDSNIDCCCLFKLPYFMNELKLTELDMGHCTPRILTASQPSVDHQGKPLGTGFYTRCSANVVLSLVHDSSNFWSYFDSLVFGAVIIWGNLSQTNTANI